MSNVTPIDPNPIDMPEVTPADTPPEAPPLQPGGGEPGDSRPYGAA